jgi:hypothetical protein
MSADCVMRRCGHCGNRFALQYRAGKDTYRRKGRRQRTLHEGRRYCSANCRKRAFEGRVLGLPGGNEAESDSDVFSTVRSVSAAPVSEAAA